MVYAFLGVLALLAFLSIAGSWLGNDQRRGR
jgi:hypothetical protein